jgi:hypothetical protein
MFCYPFRLLQTGWRRSLQHLLFCHCPGLTAHQRRAYLVIAQQSERDDPQRKEGQGDERLCTLSMVEFTNVRTTHQLLRQQESQAVDKINTKGQTNTKKQITCSVDVATMSERKPMNWKQKGRAAELSDFAVFILILHLFPIYVR